jgi:hypothetical protein
VAPPQVLAPQPRPVAREAAAEVIEAEIVEDEAIETPTIEPAAAPAPRPASDPLAPIMALSAEEKIALFT